MNELLTAANSAPGYVLLGLVAFCDTLIGVGFFVFGEVAFLAAGASWAATGQIWPALIVLCCAWAGDIASYAIGRHYGARLSLRYLTRLKRRRAWRRAQRALHRRGAVFVVLSRLLGPTAWVTPFLAGSVSMKASHFVPAAALGVMLGVGQFIVLGAVGLKGLSHVTLFLTDHMWAIGLVALLLISSIYIWRRSEAARPIRIFMVTTVAAALFLISNLTYFFVLNVHSAPTTPPPVLGTACNISQQSLLVHPGPTKLHLPQPVNVVLLSDATGAALMADLGWHQNLTFAQNQITFAGFIRLLAQNTPPVSELLLSGHPADSAFQMAGTLKTREHIRWWEFGDGISLGAISRDDELAIKYYQHMPVLLHDIDPLVDNSRDLLAGQVATSRQFEVIGYAGLGQSVPEGVRADFETDGQVLVVAQRGLEIAPDVMACLNITPATPKGTLTKL